MSTIATRKSTIDSKMSEIKVPSNFGTRIPRRRSPIRRGAGTNPVVMLTRENIVCSTPLNRIKRHLFDDNNYLVSPIRKSAPSDSSKSSNSPKKKSKPNGNEVLEVSSGCAGIRKLSKSDERVNPLSVFNNLPVANMELSSSDDEDNVMMNKIKKSQNNVAKKRNLKSVQVLFSSESSQIMKTISISNEKNKNVKVIDDKNKTTKESDNKVHSTRAKTGKVNGNTLMLDVSAKSPATVQVHELEEIPTKVVTNRDTRTNTKRNVNKRLSKSASNLNEICVFKDPVLSSPRRTTRRSIKSSSFDSSIFSTEPLKINSARKSNENKQTSSKYQISPTKSIMKGNSRPRRGMNKSRVQFTNDTKMFKNLTDSIEDGTMKNDKKQLKHKSTSKVQILNDKHSPKKLKENKNVKKSTEIVQHSDDNKSDEFSQESQNSTQNMRKSSRHRLKTLQYWLTSKNSIESEPSAINLNIKISPRIKTTSKLNNSVKQQSVKITRQSNNSNKSLTRKKLPISKNVKQSLDINQRDSTTIDLKPTQKSTNNKSKTPKKITMNKIRKSTNISRRASNKVNLSTKSISKKTITQEEDDQCYTTEEENDIPCDTLLIRSSDENLRINRTSPSVFNGNKRKVSENTNVLTKKPRCEESQTFSFKQAALAQQIPNSQGMPGVLVNGKHMECFGKYPRICQKHKDNSDLSIGLCISNSEFTCGVLEIVPSGKKSYEYPKRVNMFFVILEGAAEVGIGNSSKVLRMGECFYVPNNIPYYIYNISSTNNLILQFSKYTNK